MTAMVSVPSSLEAIEEADVSGVHEVALLPPHDLDAEAAVLSAVMLDAGAIGRVEDFLRPEHFYSERHRRIYEAAIAVKTAGTALDITTVGSRLKDTGRLAQVGGMQYVMSILDSSPAVANVRDHAMLVFERWRVRQTQQLCDRASAFGYGVVDAQAYIESVAQSLSTLARQRPGAETESNFAVLRRIVRQIYDGASARPEAVKGRGIPTGIRGIDELTLGLLAGQKTTIVAPSRVGKTAIGLQIAINVAALGISVAFFSTEMDRDEIGVRELAYLARVDSQRIQKSFQEPTLTPEEWRRITMALSEFVEVKGRIHVFDETDPSVDDICTKVKVLHEQSVAKDGSPIGLVVVDYVQKLAPAASVSNAKPYMQVKHSTERLKSLAKELKIHVIELAQSKIKEVDKAKGCRPRPELFDAAESAYIERSANQVFHLWRPKERDGSHVKAVLVKARGGKEGEVDLKFEREYSQFVDADDAVMSSPSRQYVENYFAEDQ